MEWIIFLTMGSLAIGWPFLVIYLMQKHVSKLVRKFSDDQSYLFKDLKISFKNYDLSKKKKWFPPEMLEPIYQFNSCTLIINKESILIIGQHNWMVLKNKWLNITIIANEIAKIHLGNPGFVELENMELTKTHLVIEFKSDRYPKNITAMIRIIEHPEIRNIITSWPLQ